MTGCSYCGAAAVVQWVRRPNGAEIAAYAAMVQEWRDSVALLADPQAMPAFGALPTVADTTVSVYACGAHAISLDLAALVHAPECSAPNPDHLPNCDCVPESVSAVPVEGDTLPASWGG